jgi:hypothetical protein
MLFKPFPPSSANLRHRCDAMADEFGHFQAAFTGDRQ